MMPRLDGLEVCRQLRSTGDDLPILVLTARDSVSERVAGLDAGRRRLPAQAVRARGIARADAGAAARRTTPDDGAESPALTFSDLSLDPVTREVTRGDRQISLTRTEFSLLEMLIANPRRCSPAAASSRRSGVRLPDVRQCARGVRRIPAPQDRSRRRAATDPHRARGGLCVA